MLSFAEREHSEKEAEHGVSDKVPPGFCGYCREAVITPFYKKCGWKV